MAHKKVTSSTTLPILPGTIVLLLALFLLLAGLFTVLYRAELIALPAAVQGWFAPAQKEETSPSAPDYLPTLSGQTAGTESLRSLAGLSLREKVLAAYKPETVYQYFTVTWVTGESSRTWEVYCIASDGARRADVYENGQFVRLTVERDGRQYVRDAHAGRYTPTKDGFSVEAEIGLPSLAMLQQRIADGLEAEYTPSTFNLCETVTVTFTDPDGGTRESYEILPDTGVIVSAVSTLPDAVLPHYYMSTQTLLTSFTVDKSVFEIEVTDYE